MRIASMPVVALLLAACGGGGGGGTTPPPGVTSPPSLELVAGSPGGPGSNDGIGDAARFDRPRGLAVDAQGNVYIADSGNGTVRRLSPQGQVTTIAGTAGRFGQVDGSGADARFFSPSGVAVDAAGNVFVADYHTIRRISPGGVVDTLAGSRIGHADGTGSEASFQRVENIAVDEMGYVYVADAGSCAIRRVHIATRTVTTLAGGPGSCRSESTDGIGAEVGFGNVAGLAVGPSGDVFVTEYRNAVRRIAPDGRVTTFAGRSVENGHVDGPAAAARFGFMSVIAADRAGNLFVYDSGHNTVRKITAQGVVSTIAGVAGTAGLQDGPAAAATFRTVWGIAVAPSGAVLVSEYDDGVVRSVTPGGTVATLAGLAAPPVSLDGTAGAARFADIRAMAADAAGNLYLGDGWRLRRSTPAGTVSTLATAPLLWQALLVAGDAIHAVGNATCYGRPDYQCNSKLFRLGAAGEVVLQRELFPNQSERIATALAQDGDGRLFVGTSGYTSGLVTPTAGGTIERVLAASTATMIPDLGVPRGLVAAGGPLLYVADASRHAIYRIDSFGAAVFAGAVQAPGFADGPATAARFNAPRALARDGDGSLYIADSGNHAVRRIAPDGSVSTLAGAPGTSGFMAGPLPGVLTAPVALAIVGNDLFIATPRAIAVARNFRNAR